MKQLDIKYLPEKYRKFLQTPFGLLIESEKPSLSQLSKYLSNSPFIITVGDAISENIYELDIIPNLQIIDLMEKRIPRDFPKLNWSQKIELENKAGTLSTAAFSAIKKSLKTDEKTLILVDGEEDLLALPAIFLAPINSLVLYGQPNKGFVLVKVTNKAKLIAMKILKDMGFSEENLKY